MGQFNRLVTKCYEMAHLKAPAYPVVKDLFDAIDVRKDGQIDLKEWQQAFEAQTEGSNQLSIKTTEMASWEHSRDYDKIGFLMAKHRKLVQDAFKRYLESKGVQGSLFTFSQGKKALDDWLYANFKGTVTDAQLRCVFSVAQVPTESQL